MENIDVNLLKKTELFSTLNEEELDYIVSQTGVLDLKKDGLLFSSGEQANHFYILIKGSIRVFKRREDGSEDELAMFAEGDTIGDFDFARGARYDAYATAAEDSKLIVFPDINLSMETLAQQEPRAVCNILLNAIVLITGRIKSTRKLILENMSWVQELHRRAYEDSGTGLWKQTLINDEIVNLLVDPSALIMIKPDRFKILVDSRGHAAGDEAMIKIALILKNISRHMGNSWPLRFKSNEVGIIFNNCSANQAEVIAEEISKAISSIEPVPAQGDIPSFNFSSTIAWSVWREDNSDWDTMFKNNYECLLETWKAGGNTIVRSNQNTVKEMAG